MTKLTEEKDQAYRIVEALYELHNDLFQVQELLGHMNWLQLRLARLRRDSLMGVGIAALLALVSVLVSTSPIAFQSAPAIVLFGIAGGLTVLWIRQTRETKKLERYLQGMATPWRPSKVSIESLTHF